MDFHKHSLKLKLSQKFELVTQLKFSLSNTFKSTFQDTSNLICSCESDVETSTLPPSCIIDAFHTGQNWELVKSVVGTKIRCLFTFSSRN